MFTELIDKHIDLSTRMSQRKEIMEDCLSVKLCSAIVKGLTQLSKLGNHRYFHTILGRRIGQHSRKKS